jgi:hypothetical protein
VTEIWYRWKSAVHRLAPIVDYLPAFLIIAIALFVAGLVDTLLTASSGLEGKTAVDIDAGAIICIVIFCAVVCTLMYTILHAIIDETSPFHSSFAGSVSKCIKRARWIITYYCVGKQSQQQVAKDNKPSIIAAYKGIMKETFDDSLLDDGTSVLGNIIRWGEPGRSESASADQGVSVAMPKDNVSPSSMLDLLEYLLSPTASRRSALTAAKIICDHADDCMSCISALTPLRSS